MSNPAFMTVCIEGDRRQQRSLYGKMLRLERRKKPLVENGFHCPQRWLGCLVARLGGDWHEVYCRGTWDNLRLRDGELCFDTETAWEPPFGLLQLIQACYPQLRCVYMAEGDWESYLTNDTEGKHFTSRYVVDTEPDIEYLDTIEEACSYLSAFIGKPAGTSWEALKEAAGQWNDEHPEADWPVSVKQIEVT